MVKPMHTLRQTLEYGVCRTESTDNMATMVRTSSLVTQNHSCNINNHRHKQAAQLSLRGRTQHHTAVLRAKYAQSSHVHGLF